MFQRGKYCRLVMTSSPSLWSCSGTGAFCARDVAGAGFDPCSKSRWAKRCAPAGNSDSRTHSWRCRTIRRSTAGTLPSSVAHAPGGLGNVRVGVRSPIQIVGIFLDHFARFLVVHLEKALVNRRLHPWPLHCGGHWHVSAMHCPRSCMTARIWAFGSPDPPEHRTRTHVGTCAVAAVAAGLGADGSRTVCIPPAV